MKDRLWRIQHPAELRGKFKQSYEVGRKMIESGAIEVVLRDAKSKRSIEQNKRYWKILREVAAVAWIDGKQFDDETWHEYFRRLFIGANEITLPDGSTLLRGISTTTLNVAEFTDYMDAIVRWSSENGFELDVM